jgi:hypothetical protein
MLSGAAAFCATALHKAVKNKIAIKNNRFIEIGR